MEKKISILGSTGSIGVNALNVIRNISQEYEIVHLTGNKNADLMIEQCREFHHKSIVMINEKAAEKVEKEKGRDVGLIAQEVQKVLPEIVQTRPNGTLAIQYDKVVPLLVEAIKEQQNQIEELKGVSLGYKKLLDAKEKHFVKKQRENKIKEKLKKDGLVISKYGK